MAFPWGQLPTLGQFVDRAKTLGCRELSVIVNGPSGPITSRILVGPSGKPIPLPIISSGARLTPLQVGALERQLSISTGYPSI
jgi:hypothetical protein